MRTYVRDDRTRASPNQRTRSLLAGRTHRGRRNVPRGSAELAPLPGRSRFSMVDRDIIERAGELLGVSGHGECRPGARAGRRRTACASVAHALVLIGCNAFVRLWATRRHGTDRPSNSRATRRTRDDSSTMNVQPRRSAGLRVASPSARSPSGSARASGGILTDLRAGPDAPPSGTATVSGRLAVLVLVRHSARFAALFLGGASWWDYAEHSHCLQAE